MATTHSLFVTILHCHVDKAIQFLIRRKLTARIIYNTLSIALQSTE